MAALTNIFDYMRVYASELGDRIVESYPPVQAPGDPLSPEFAKLKRKPLTAQALAIQGTAKFLETCRAAKIVAECGTGKTLMSMATCFVHAKGRPFSAIVMCPPHLTKKWAREVFLTLPNTRVFLIEDMRNGGDPKKPHGVVEVVLSKDRKTVERRGMQLSLSELRAMGRKRWRKRCPGTSFFIMSKEKGKLSYFWKHAFGISKSKTDFGAVINVETGFPVARENGGQLVSSDFNNAKQFEEISHTNGGTKLFSPLWQADRSKIQRVAPLEYIGRYMKGWFDYAIADELHQLSNDTAQGNGLGVLARAAHRLIGLTGTMMGGYADDLYNILYRMDGPMMARAGYAWGGEGRRLFQGTYGVLEEIRKHTEFDNACSKASKDSITVKRRPGCSPLLFGQYLMENTAFVSLEDIADNLPSYTESVVPVTMDSMLGKAYKGIEEAIKRALEKYPRNPSLVSLMFNTLLCYPDHPYGFGALKAKVQDPVNGGYNIVHVCDTPDLDESRMYAKEEALLADIRSEIVEGRRVQVFATFTGKHDVTGRLKTVLEREGLRVAVLRSTVATDVREQWYASRLAEGVQVVICHPRLVETGLDLLEFPTIYFYETGYSLHTLRQASRRSWRIGQKHPVRVKFLFYSETVQERCVKLMGKKMLVALMMEGKFSGEGLDGFEEDDDMMTSMVRELLESGGVGESADAIWRNLERERSVHAPGTSHTEIEQILEHLEETAEPVPAGFAAETGSEVRIFRSLTSGVLDFSGTSTPAVPAEVVPFPEPKPKRQPVVSSVGQMLLFG